MKRDRILTEHHYGRTRREATRAGLASPNAYTATLAALNALDRGWDRGCVVVDLDALAMAESRFEDVSTRALEDFANDVQHELARRNKPATS